MESDRTGDAQGPVAQRSAPTLKERMEAESRRWMVRCGQCGYEQSVWAWGGVRYKAAGTSRQYKQCPACGKWNWHKVYLPKEAPGGAAVSTLAAPGLPTTPHPRSIPWRFILGLVAIIAVFAATLVIVLLLLLETVVGPANTAGDSFMSALKAGDYARAYALCTPDLQKEFGDAPALANIFGADRLAQWSWNGRGIRNGVAYFDGSFTYANGKGGDVQLNLRQVNDAWRVSYFKFNPK